MVSVIIVSFKTKDLTCKCIEKVLLSKGVELEIIVVDNASNDGTIEEIKKKFRQVKLIENKSNVGYGRANNQGMAKSSGEYILLLNSDCFVLPDTIKRLVEENADFSGCKLLNEDGSVQQSFGFFPNLLRIFMLMTFLDNLPIVRDYYDSLHVRSIKRYQHKTNVDWVTGALILLKRNIYEETRGFDDSYFMYGEEIEWQYRVTQKGYQIVYNPVTSATHLVGASSPDRSSAILGEMKSWKYWFRKYHKGVREHVLLWIIGLGCILRMIFKPKLAKFYWNGFFALSKI